MLEDPHTFEISIYIYSTALKGLDHRKRTIEVGIRYNRLDSKGEITEQPQLSLRSTTPGIHVLDRRI